MKSVLLCMFFPSLLFAQTGCFLITPDSLRTIPDYWNIFQGDTVTFTTYGGLGDSTSWYALYGEECCVTRLDSNKTGIFTMVVTASDIFYSRIESYCDTTWGASIDIDAWERITGIPHPASFGGDPLLQGEGAPFYNFLGQKIPPEVEGIFIKNRRLYLKRF